MGNFILIFMKKQNLLRLFFIIALVTLLSNCGVRGPLELPVAQSENHIGQHDNR